jgi:uncharacterized protein (TIRG00374 family)
MNPTDQLVAEPVADAGLDLPKDFDRRKLLVRLATLIVIVIAVVAAIALLPGLGSLRSRFSHANAGWLILGAALKILSIYSYVILFRAVFCRRMSFRASQEIGIAELGANALIPAGGAGGLALGAWALRRGGMSPDHIAKRTVAFFLITSAANVVALILFGLALAIGILPGHASLALTLVPAGVAVAAIVATLAVGRLAHRIEGRIARGRGEDSRLAKIVGALGDGVDETLALIAEHNPSLVAGAIGYLAFDIMIVWASFHAYGHAPPLAIIWIGYLIGQLGGILPLPGGIGGVDGGLIATYTVYGISVGAASAAVLSYRIIALWIPAVMGLAAFLSLRRRVAREKDHLAVCRPGEEVDVGLGRVRHAGAAQAAST